MKRAILLALAGMCIASTPAVRAASIYWSGGNANWSDAAGWGGTEPAPEDIAFNNQNAATLTLTTTKQVTGLYNAVNGGNVTSAVTIAPTGSLTVTGGGNNMWIGAQANLSPTGTLTVQGELNYNGFIRMAAFQDSGTTASGNLVVDGGTVALSGGSRIFMTMAGYSTTAEASLTIKNGGALNGLGNLDAGDGVTTFNLTLGDTGIDPIDIAGNMTLSAAGNHTLNVDMTGVNLASLGYSVPLFEIGGTLSGTFDTINVIGGVGEVIYDGDTIALVPEPASASLLAVLAVSLAGRAGLAASRRRRRRRA
jgi:hypothetical protein